jgi:hypothetical protein
MYSSLWTELHSSLFPLSSTLFTCLSELGSISNHGGQGELVTTAAIGKEKKARSVRGGLCCMQLQMKCRPLVCSLARRVPTTNSSINSFFFLRTAKVLRRFRLDEERKKWASIRPVFE